jgi:hypothetical protein
MKRMILTAVATVSLAAPGVALARNGERHHHHHHGRHHQVHVLAFHAQAPAGSSSGTTAPSSTPSSSDSAGTIASFSNGLLTITLSDGSAVSGKVTERTEIECRAPTASAADFSGGDSGDDCGGEAVRAGSSDGEHGDVSGHDGAGDDDANDNDDNDEAEHCTSAALVAGASVTEAFLSVSSAGATWLKVEL